MTTRCAPPPPRPGELLDAVLYHAVAGASDSRTRERDAAALLRSTEARALALRRPPWAPAAGPAPVPPPFAEPIEAAAAPPDFLPAEGGRQVAPHLLAASAIIRTLRTFKRSGRHALDAVPYDDLVQRAAAVWGRQLFPEIDDADVPKLLEAAIDDLCAKMLLSRRFLPMGGDLGPVVLLAHTAGDPGTGGDDSDGDGGGGGVLSPADGLGYDYESGAEDAAGELGAEDPAGELERVSSSGGPESLPPPSLTAGTSTTMTTALSTHAGSPVRGDERPWETFDAAGGESAAAKRRRVAQPAAHASPTTPMQLPPAPPPTPATQLNRNREAARMDRLRGALLSGPVKGSQKNAGKTRTGAAGGEADQAPGQAEGDGAAAESGEGKYAWPVASAEVEYTSGGIVRALQQVETRYLERNHPAYIVNAIRAKKEEDKDKRQSRWPGKWTVAEPEQWHEFGSFWKHVPTMKNRYSESDGELYTAFIHWLLNKYKRPGSVPLKRSELAMEMCTRLQHSPARSFPHWVPDTELHLKEKGYQEGSEDEAHRGWPHSFVVDELFQFAVWAWAWSGQTGKNKSAQEKEREDRIRAAFRTVVPPPDDERLPAALLPAGDPRRGLPLRRLPLRDPCTEDRPAAPPPHQQAAPPPRPPGGCSPPPRPLAEAGAPAGAAPAAAAAQAAGSQEGTSGDDSDSSSSSEREAGCGSDSDSSASSEREARRCAACGRSDLKLLRCGGCKKVYYCNRQCQRDHRPKHKALCAPSGRQEAGGARTAPPPRPAGGAGGGADVEMTQRTGDVELIDLTALEITGDEEMTQRTAAAASREEAGAPGAAAAAAMPPPKPDKPPPRAPGTQPLPQSRPPSRPPSWRARSPGSRFRPVTSSARVSGVAGVRRPVAVPPPRQP